MGKIFHPSFRRGGMRLHLYTTVQFRNFFKKKEKKRKKIKKNAAQEKREKVN
jgi:hypothetical protein